MRNIALYSEGGGTAAAAPAWDYPESGCRDCTQDGYPGIETKDDLTTLLSGGMTLDAEPGAARFLHAGSPEPVIGYGGTKGIFAYYEAVRYFQELAE